MFVSKRKARIENLYYWERRPTSRAKEIISRLSRDNVLCFPECRGLIMRICERFSNDKQRTFDAIEKNFLAAGGCYISNGDVLKTDADLRTEEIVNVRHKIQTIVDDAINKTDELLSKMIIDQAKRLCELKDIEFALGKCHLCNDYFGEKRAIYYDSIRVIGEIESPLCKKCLYFYRPIIKASNDALELKKLSNKLQVSERKWRKSQQQAI